MIRKVILGACLAASTVSYANAQDATRPDVRYCGLGLQGALDGFKRENPNLGKLYADPKFRAAMYAALLQKSKGAGWKVNMYGKDEAQGKGAHLGLSHVLTYENVESNAFVDPRDGKSYYNVAYSFGVNTVLFDLNDRQIKTLIPSMVVYNEVRPIAPDALSREKGFAAIFQGLGDTDSAMERWLESIRALPISYDERTFFQVMPIALSDDARSALAASAKGGQNPALFSKRMTAQYEALLAVAFGKPIVPVAVTADGKVAPGNQYVANIPECLGASANLTLPDPSYKMQLTLEKISSAALRHDMPATQNGISAAAFQTEFAYGGRFRNEVIQFDNVTGGKPVEARSFRFVKSLRFSGSRDVNGYEQYSKLTSNFVKELLDAYAEQNKDWIQGAMSASVTDKKQRDAGRIAKDWKTLFQGTMKITPAAKKTDADS